MSDIVERLRKSTEAMASACSAPMGLWDQHSNLALSAAGEIERLRRAMSADDERLRLAAERVGIQAGCDAADEMADEILRLRTLLSEAEQREKDARRVHDGWCLVPKELTPEIMQNLQMNTEIGAYVCENLSGAYALMDKYHLALVEASKRALQSEER